MFIAEREEGEEQVVHGIQMWQQEIMSRDQ